MKRLSLRKNFVWTLGGSGVYQACQFGVLASIAKITNVEQVGQFSLALAICAPIVLFTGLNLRVALASDVKNEYNFGSYLGLRVTTSLLAFLIIAAVAFFSNYSSTTKFIIILIAINKLIEDGSTVIYGLFQQKERMDIISHSMWLRGIGGLVIFVSFLLMWRNICYSIIGWSFWSLFTLLFYDVLNARKFEKVEICFDKSKLINLALKIFPLAIVMGIMSLKANIPRYFLANYGGEEMVGYFSAVVSILMAANLVNQALATAAIARFSKYYVSNHGHFMSLYWKLMGIALALMFIAIAVCWFFGKQLLTIAYKAEYAEYWNVLCIAVIGTGFGFFVSMGSSAFTATRRFKWQPLIYVIVLITSLLSCSILIPKYGITGAAWSTVVVTGTHAILFVIAVMLSSNPSKGEIKLEGVEV